MPYTVQDYHNHAKFIPRFFKGLRTQPVENFQRYEIRDVHESDPANAVAAVWIWTLREGYPVGHICFVDSAGGRFKEESTHEEIAERFDSWLADVRARKEEFEAFMEGIATNYRPLSVSELHELARPE
jgi:hypothetical protein